MTVWPKRGDDPRQAIADDGRAEVADVHRLGDVGRGKVDDDGARMRRAARSRRLDRSRASCNARGDPVVIQTQVQETGAGHLGRAGDRGQIDASARFPGPGRAGFWPSALASAMQPLA